MAKINQDASVQKIFSKLKDSKVNKFKFIEPKSVTEDKDIKVMKNHSQVDLELKYKNIKKDKRRIRIGDKVTVFDMHNKNNLEVELVLKDEADFTNGKISIDSPLGEALLGKELNEVIEIITDRNRYYKIYNIRSIDDVEKDDKGNSKTSTLGYKENIKENTIINKVEDKYVYKKNKIIKKNGGKLMISQEIIELLNSKYTDRSMELSQSISLVNLVLEDIINDLILDTKNLLDIREYNDVEKLINFQKNINNYIEKNIDLISYLEIDDEIIEDEELEEKSMLEQPDYEKYLVNSQTPHNLYENFKFKRPDSFEIEGVKINSFSWKEMLLETAKYLYRKNPKLFKTFVNDKTMNGKKRAYFSLDRNKLRKAKRVEGTNIYLETNQSANSIKQIIMKMLKKYNIGIADFVVYLRADYTELNRNT